MIGATDKAVLQFSGGKDSLACLYLLRPHWKRLTVAWVNTGAAYPETVALMDRVRAMVPDFLEVKSDQPSNIAKYGPPADIVPVPNSPEGRALTQSDAEPIQSHLQCCNANVWWPMQCAMQERGATLIIRGKKLADGRKSAVRSGEVRDGVRYWFPLEDWTEDDVRAYLIEQRVELPAHYAYTKTSLDCWSCTAYTDENAGRIKYMRDYQPELWAKWKPNMQRILRASNAQLAQMSAALGGE